MKRVIEIGEHSVYAPALAGGGYVLDAGANRGRFSKEICARFPTEAYALEANPVLASALRREGMRVIECALGPRNGVAVFHIGTNDEASSTRIPKPGGAHLVVKESVSVSMRKLTKVLQELNIHRLACVKLDIEGGEVDVLNSVAHLARQISPQWTIEFHDGPEFRLCEVWEVDAAIAGMERAGFSTLIRNWPSRSNVLFVDRQALSIHSAIWLGVKIRYQYLAVLWRRLVGLK